MGKDEYIFKTYFVYPKGGKTRSPSIKTKFQAPHARYVEENQ